MSDLRSVEAFQQEIQRLVSVIVAVDGSWAAISAGRDLNRVFADPNYSAWRVHLDAAFIRTIDSLVANMPSSTSKVTLLEQLANNKIFVGDTSAARAMAAIRSEVDGRRSIKCW